MPRWPPVLANREHWMVFMAGRENSLNPRTFERPQSIRLGTRHLIIIPAIRIVLLVLMIFAVLAKVTSAAGSISFVQVTSAVPQAPQTSVTVTYTKAQAAGNLNVVAVGWNDSTATVSTVTDKSGNTYTLAVGPTVQSGVASQSIYYAKNIAAAAAGANIVTVTFSSAAVSPDIRILEYSGADPNNPVDVTAASSGGTATTSSGPVNTTNATDLLFGANLVQTTTRGPGSGFTKRVLTSPDGDIAEDQMVTATGSYSATAPLSSGPGLWIMQMVVFRGRASKLALTVQPTNVVAATTITPAVTVTIEDAQGNPVTTATNAVTMAIGTNPSSGTLAGTLTVNAIAGVATFADLSINAVGSGYTLAASGTGLTGATSNSFNLAAVIITAQPLSQTVVVGETATFSVAASGSGLLGYQWLANGLGIPGATSKSYTTAATTLANSGGQFSVIVSDAFGNLSSSAATLTVVQP